MKVVLPKSVQKELDKIPNKIAQRVIEHIFELEDGPFPHGYEKLAADEGYRIRIGNYRAVYRIDKLNNQIRITRVRHRKEVYRK